MSLTHRSRAAAESGRLHLDFRRKKDLSLVVETNFNNNDISSPKTARTNNRQRDQFTTFDYHFNFSQKLL